MSGAANAAPASLQELGITCRCLQDTSLVFVIAADARHLSDTLLPDMERRSNGSTGRDKDEKQLMLKIGEVALCPVFAIIGYSDVPMDNEFSR